MRQRVLASGLKGILIDFGKACLVSNAKQYKLSNPVKLKYIRHHPQIAPDLRDGKCKQSVQSDIYSFGRILSIVNEACLHLPVLTSLSIMCTEMWALNDPLRMNYLHLCPFCFLNAFVT